MGEQERRLFCTKCRELLLMSCFYDNPKDKNNHGKHRRCKECDKGSRREARLVDGERLNKLSRDRRLNRRNHIITTLGGKCYCCGEDRYVFLAIDHTNGGGNQERKGVSTAGILLRIVKQGIPKDKYRVLCHNCNFAIAILGYCPHHPRKTKVPNDIN